MKLTLTNYVNLSNAVTVMAVGLGCSKGAFSTSGVGVPVPGRAL